MERDKCGLEILARYLPCIKDWVLAAIGEIAMSAQQISAASERAGFGEQ